MLRTVCSFFLVTIFSLVLAGCATDDPASPDSTGKESDAAGALKSDTNKAAETAGTGVKAAGDATGKALEKAGDATGKALKTAGDATKDAGKATGEAIGGDKKREE